ncbi:ATP-binding protein [Candidatus Woesearchaeota archaeon]|nr:ATP-binding protein [Candidatus Woesearchaeota archaeon]
MIDATVQIEKFREFLELQYQNKINEIINQGKKSLLIDFSDLSKFDVELSEQLLEEPEETIKAAEIALSQFDIAESNLSKIRFFNLVESQKVLIRNIRSNNLNDFMSIEGIVRQASDVRPQVTMAKFECPSCGNTITIPQLDSKFKEPSRCSCGRRGKFRLLSKELVDVQRLVIEEMPEMLEGGEQQKRISVFLSEDLVEPKMEKKTTPGSKVRVTGMIKEVPLISKSGAQSTRYDIVIEANYIEPIEEIYEEIDISKEEAVEIKRLANDERIFEKLRASIAPTIYGHETIKDALVLQMFGGVRKIKEDGTKNRGDIHILLIGDPGCISGDSQVSLINKGMEQIQNLGKKHMEPILEAVTKIRKGPYDKPYDFATTFQYYKQQPVLKVVTETGKEVICTYNQPFLTKDGWKRADEIPLGTKIRVMPKISNNTKNLALTNFTRAKKGSGVLKEVNIPEKVTPELASLYGYMIGNGNIHPNGYRVACYVNNEEIDLIEKISGFWKNTFGVGPSIIKTKVDRQIKTIDNGNGLLREIISAQELYILEINSRQVAESLLFLAHKRAPQQIFRSPKYIVARFISWLFEANGCAFGKGRGKTSIQLKSRTLELLKDVQLLLLYFGIHSMVIEDNLFIRRSYGMELFAKYIGFNSEKKKNALNEVLDVIKNKSWPQKRKKFQRYEEINGIVCHNSGKSQTLQFVAKAAPKGRFVSGRGASGAGLTATVVKDEFLRGFALEAGAMVLANRGIAVIDELDKMSPEDRSALHEALEQQTVTITKANIQATLRAETTVLAAANPKFGRFDPYTPIASQIDLPPTLINRFDLIFPVKDLPNKEKDEKIARHVLTVHQHPSLIEPEIPIKVLKKYISYARKNFKPVLTDAAVNEITEFYVGLRNEGSSIGETEIKRIPITARQLEALVRLSEASAKVRLSDKVTKKDAQIAIKLLEHCLMEVGIDRETGKIDIDKISTGITATTRNRIHILKEAIDDLEARLGKTIPLEELVIEAVKRGIDEEKVEELIENMKRSGDIFEPKRGFIQKI